MLVPFLCLLQGVKIKLRGECVHKWGARSFIPFSFRDFPMGYALHLAVSIGFITCLSDTVCLLIE